MNIVYWVQIVAIVASPLRGRGRVRIKSSDQHPRDLATLDLEVPLGHPTVDPLVTKRTAQYEARMRAKRSAHKSNYLQDAGGDSSPSSPPLFPTLPRDYRKLVAAQALLSTVSIFVYVVSIVMF